MKHFFSIASHPQLPLVVAKATERRPKDVDKDGFQLRYIAALDGAASDYIVELLDGAMGPKTKAPGVYHAKYDEVREALQNILDDAPKPKAPPMVFRVLAGIAAVALTAAFGFFAVAGTIFWLAVCAMKRQSGLLTMAETAVVWRILDWRWARVPRNPCR